MVEDDDLSAEMNRTRLPAYSSTIHCEHSESALFRIAIFRDRDTFPL